MGSQVWSWISLHVDVALGGTAAFLRLAYLLAAGGVSTSAGDAAVYLPIARSIADGDLTAKGYPFQALYSVTLSPAYMLDVPVEWWAAALHLVLSVATVLVLYRIAALVCSGVVALGVGLVTACWPPFIFWTKFIETETLFLFLLSVFLLYSIRQLVAPSGDRREWAILAASAIGVAFCRSVGVLMVAAVLVVLLGATVRWRRDAASARKTVLAVVLIGAIAAMGLLTFGPTREKVLSNTNVAWSLYLSSINFHSSVEHASRRAAPPEDIRHLSLEEQNRELSDRGLEFMRDHPADYASRAGIRFANYVFPWLTADWGFPHLALDFVLSIGLLGLALLGVGTTPAGSRREVAVLLIVVAAVQAAAVTFGELDSEGRYRVPVELALLVVAGMGVDNLRRRERLTPSTRSR